MNAMDVRHAAAPPRRRHLLAGLAGAAVLAAVIAAVALLLPSKAGPIVDRSAIVTDTARRGALTISVAAAGILSAEDVRVVDAIEPGVVQSVEVKPGAVTAPGDVIARMASPDAQAALVGAASALQVAQAQLRSAQAQLQASALAQRSALAAAQAQMEVDATNYGTAAELHRNGYVADSAYQIAKIKRIQSQRELAINQSQIGVEAADQEARVAAAQAQVNDARALLAAKQDRCAHGACGRAGDRSKRGGRPRRAARGRRRDRDNCRYAVAQGRSASARNPSSRHLSRYAVCYRYRQRYGRRTNRANRADGE
jgi:multidrug efflux pump subunit AcrA (membrane-fusion protein)